MREVKIDIVCNTVLIVVIKIKVREQTVLVDVSGQAFTIIKPEYT